MCGIFGFVTRSGKGPDMKVLKKLALVTESRGEHAFGMAWTESDGSLQSFKRPGSASDGLADLNRVRDASAIIAHCRWATHGSPDDNANNHPHRAGKGWLIHNGVVSNYLELIQKFSLEPQSECDSEVLSLLMDVRKGTLLDRATFVYREAQGSMAIMGLWTNPVRMLILRDERPLHFGEDERGLYFASLAAGLPGRVNLLRNRKAYKLMSDKGELYMDARELKEKQPARDSRTFRKYIPQFC